MKWEVVDIQGRVVEQVELPDGIFAAPVRKHLLYLATKRYLANQRQGTHMAKTRAFVSGGGKKPFKQKGTGSARQGTTRAPQHAGGASAFGPQPRCYRQGMPRAAREAALVCALSDKVRSKKLIVVDDFKLEGYKTRHVVGVLKQFGAGSALLSDERKDDFLARSARNIYRAQSVAPLDMTALDVLAHESLVLSKNAVRSLSTRLGKKEGA